MLACPICSWAFEKGRFRTVPYPTKHDNTFEHKPERIVFCENCGAGIALPLVSNEELEKFYAQGDYWGDPGAKVLSPKEYPVPCALALSRWGLVESFLERRKKSVSILDVGAGHGFFGICLQPAHPFPAAGMCKTSGHPTRSR